MTSSVQRLARRRGDVRIIEVVGEPADRLDVLVVAVGPQPLVAFGPVLRPQRILVDHSPRVRRTRCVRHIVYALPIAVDSIARSWKAGGVQVALALSPGVSADECEAFTLVFEQLADTELIGVGARLGHVDGPGGGHEIDALFDEVQHPDIVLVPGGLGCAQTARDEPFLAWLRAVAPRCQWMAASSTGTVVVAAAGLLGERRGGHALARLGAARVVRIDGVERAHRRGGQHHHVRRSDHRDARRAPRHAADGRARSGCPGQSRPRPATRAAAERSHAVATMAIRARRPQERPRQTPKSGTHRPGRDRVRPPHPSALKVDGVKCDCGPWSRRDPGRTMEA